MPNLLAPIQKAICQSVRKSAGAHGGSCTWPFTQMYGDVAKVIGKNDVTKEGICEMLSAFWIERHAKGSSLASYVAKPGNTASDGLDMSKIRQMMQLFIIGNEMHPDAMFGQNAHEQGMANQTEATKRWLTKKGVPYLAKTSSTRQGGHSDFGVNLSKALVNMGATGGNSGVYATIGIWGPDGGHAMAAFMSGGKVTFFDPNFGEFAFGNSASFKAWFPTFWKTSTYGRKTLGANLSDKYEIMTYAT